VLVRAINDKNSDGACSSGEEWAQAEAVIAEDDSVEAVTMTLALTACPSE
jgi:hypothetical protein